MKLQVVIAIENIVLAIVLVVQRHLHAAQTDAERFALIGARCIAGIRIAAPIDVCLRKVGVGLPVFLIDQRQNAGAITARLGAKDAVRGALLRFFRRQALTNPVAELRQVMLAHEIVF